MLQPRRQRRVHRLTPCSSRSVEPSYRKRDEVANEHRARGMRLLTHQGECGKYLDEAIAEAAEAVRKPALVALKRTHGLHI